VIKVPYPTLYSDVKTTAVSSFALTQITVSMVLCKAKHASIWQAIVRTLASSDFWLEPPNSCSLAVAPKSNYGPKLEGDR
jgi:hypothetical protein